MNSDYELQPEDLVGTWSLHGWQMLSGPERATKHPFGEDAQGMLIYTAAGFVSATINQTTPTGDTEPARAGHSFLHYLARFQLKHNTVTHTVFMASAMQMVGHAHSRQIEVLGPDTLRYTGVDNLGSATERKHIFIWQRVPDEHQSTAVRQPLATQYAQ